MAQRLRTRRPEGAYARAVQTGGGQPSNHATNVPVQTPTPTAVSHRNAGIIGGPSSVCFEIRLSFASCDVAIAEEVTELVDDWRPNRAATIRRHTDADHAESSPTAAPTIAVVIKARMKNGMITRMPGERRSGGGGEHSGECQCHNTDTDSPFDVHVHDDLPVWSPINVDWRC
jgi:hypothetical protein